MLDAESNAVAGEIYICYVVGFSCLPTVLMRSTVKIHCVQKQSEILISFISFLYLYCMWQYGVKKKPNTTFFFFFKQELGKIVYCTR